MTSAEQDSKRHLHIILVEDNPGDAYLFEEALQQSGRRTTLITFESGQKAIDYFKAVEKKLDPELPDVIVLDFHLPDLEPEEILRVLKDSPVFQKIPTIVMSSSDNPSDIDRAYAWSADSYVVKPAFVTEFSRVVTAVEDACHRALGI